MPTFELSTLCTSISICVYAIVTVHGMASQVYYRCRKPCKGPYYYTIPSKPAAAAMCNASGSHDCLGRSSRSRSHTALPACKKNLTCSQSLAAPNHSKAKKAFIRRVQRPLQIHANWSLSWWNNLVRPSTQTCLRRLLWDVCPISQGDIRSPIIIGLK